MLVDDEPPAVPHRRLQPGTLVIASHNEGKVREIRALLAPYGIEPVSAASLDIPEPVETGTTFFANAELKARFSADLAGIVALADDSGLCVDALGGDPGVYTADWAETPNGRDWTMAMEKVESALAAADPDAGRDAHFVSVLSLCWPDGHVESFEGRAEGHLVWPPRGTIGFGYDPMFMPNGYDQTFAELDPAEKNRISHRAAAFAKLVAACLAP
ncbi:RdgB/HAM1 family non-canonical purine NTP pyrophosphatase [Sphingomonas nostoxanthinifaciens]|uniref:RdgB/HAM1 family non-canonical purine NTP pyrophosphatase n=1 Tax=Sphingomonas nostoxanthinifaciens TaxID=2872652 RepID=UPI001CC21507|nr:RdgB/HAM1 family non-canonical purine NTP pyrophosphatase [Sphingomonas nostoxanthinifaciens]UAK26594.1 RdgB/HAM1 family non-canonical purine NTP pyrophosphatase [Sphingomonas nostoxanthinifaciens]